MAFGALAALLLLAGLAGEALAETIREVQIADTVVAYDADRFRVTSQGADSLEVNCKREDCSPGIGIFAQRSVCGAPQTFPRNACRVVRSDDLLQYGITDR